MDDPLPYGIALNPDTLTNLMQQVVAQGIIDAPLMLEDLSPYSLSSWSVRTGGFERHTKGLGPLPQLPHP